MASPTTPVTTEKYKTERVCEGPSREIIDLVDETAPLEQFSSNQVEPFEKNAVANPLEELVVQQANGENQEDIDLNKTPQKKARRKKHRPKVIQEGKPKRTRKKETPIALKPPENPSGKRKYVRRKKDEKPQETPSCALGESVDCDNQTRNISVRRSLNFDLEDSQTIDQPSETQAREAHASDLHSTASGGGFENNNVRVPQTQYQFANGNVRVPQTQNQCGNENVRIPQTQNQFGHENAGVLQTPNQPPQLSRNDSVRVPETPNQPPQLSRNDGVRVPESPNQPPQLSTNENVRVPCTPNQPPQLSRNDGVRVLQTTNQPPQLSRNENLTVPQTLNQPPQLSSLEMTKKRWQDDFARMVFNMTPAPHPAEKVSENPERPVTKIDCQNISEVGRAKSNKISDVLPQGTKRVYNLVDGAQVLRFHDIKKKRRIETGQRELPSNAFSTPNRNSPSRQNTRKGFGVAEAQKLRALEKRQFSNRILVVNQAVREAREIKIQVHTPITHGNNVGERDKISTPTTCDCNQPSTPEKSLEYSYGPRSRVETLISYQTKQEARSRKRKEHNTLNANQLVPYRDPMDEIVTKLLNLDINTEVMNEVQNALIPYGVGDGTMVLIKKRKPRAKVDLDPESHKVWRLLMGLERSEGAEGTDMDKERWWEEERRIFRGRADSFIARMHLIQGDRTFSPWKGSVVDSVIGVFLTQNVSDHLSSSAFMCLAARFPPKSKANNIAANVETIHKPLVSEPEFCEQSLSGINESLEKESSSDFHELDRGIDHESPDSVLGTAVHVASCAIEEDRVLSQNSSSRCPVQRTNENKLSPSLNFEADELFRRGRANGFNSFTELLKMANDRVLIDLNVASNAKRSSQEYGGGIDWAAVLRVNSRTDSAPSAIELHEKNINDACRSSKNTAQPFQFENHYHCHIESSLKGNASSVAVETHVKIQNSINPPTCPNSTNDNRRNDAVDVGAAESNLRNEAQKGSAETLNNELKSKKVKSEAEKKPAIDWDCLRKQVHQNSVRKERNSNAMDSLDYEALLNADVSEISNTIRERGMNNLLAERIKAFLDRLVRDHGSIDLEWLRDVPPDKAKDYLLSIRGLGLKSVECVRLLTLHHLAFPVDTNVGRIAVRLGWVPLQPLPESLQLHLLEMYPVMETIQKYLWPRLCKLDQQKLYELHYQLITFGKVFCTKSKPNCNACPMRAECKHFASAYASARLALPGPEEKHIVTSEIPFASEVRNPIPNPMPLPQLEGNTFSQEQTIPINCEPTIEEPATPEPECIETTEIDIEDAFYNDPDEIPTIKLDFEEFTQNLQNYMQENNLGLQDGDMSKALVAITPEAASIPAPKLKNVNRLRTEHQVYELPDGHPLLEGMDKREPDDPCPYLLAIWTPGETAQSTEAPKSCCNSQGPVKLCDMSTCFSCNSIREAQNQTVRGTILIPCRTANRGSFPLNGTYFQVNEVFADHDSSCNPIDVPRDWIWKLARRTVYFGTSMPSIFKGLTTEGIQHCFWRGFVCVRGFDRTTRAPKPLFARLHFPASKSPRNRKTTTAAAAATPQQQG